ALTSGSPIRGAACSLWVACMQVPFTHKPSVAAKAISSLVNAAMAATVATFFCFCVNDFG
ncbi:unnamed protein product, partial [Musa textilis]